MLSQKHRLSKSAEVKKTTARGRGFFNPYFVIKSVPGKEEAKITVIVSTKVSKKAVDRNRIKRVMREEIRKNLSSFKPGHYAFLVKAAAARIESKDLRAAVSKSLIDAKIIRS